MTQASPRWMRRCDLKNASQASQAHLFSLYSFAASELAGEFGLGSHRSDCTISMKSVVEEAIGTQDGDSDLQFAAVICDLRHTWMEVKIADTS